MGFFSSKKKVLVSTAVVRVVEDNGIPDLRRRSAIKSVLNDDRFARVILEETMNSKVQGIERAYRYAKSGAYYYGTPNHNVSNAAKGQDVVKNIIESDLGKAIEFEYFYFAPINNLHAGWQKLTEEYQYDNFSNEVMGLTALRGQRVFVNNLIGHIDTTVMASDDPDIETSFPTPDAGTLVTWERHPHDRYSPHPNPTKESIWLLSETAIDGVMAELVGLDGTAEELFFSLEDFDEDREYFQAKYRYLENGTIKYGYFTYGYNSGQYPVLDSIHEGQAVGQGTFFPITFFRHNDQNRTATALHNTAAYKTSVKMLKMYGMDYQSLGDSINENPGVDDIEQAVMMFAVPAGSNNEVDKRYLFDFFEWAYYQNPSKQSQYANSTFNSYMPGKSISIYDRDFNCTLSFAGLNRKVLTGVMGKRNSYHSRTGTINSTTTVSERAYTEEFGWVTVSRVIPISIVVQHYTYQISDNRYVEVTVNNLRLRYNIYGDKGIEANLGSDKLLIPLDYNITKRYSAHDKEILYFRSMHLVFNTRKTVKVKWYQRGAFKFVLIIIAAAITVFSGGTAGPIAASLLSIGVSLTVAIIIEVIVISLIFEQVVKFAIKEFGFEGGAILAAIALYYGVAMGGVPSLGMTPTQLILVSTNLVSAAQSAYYQEKIAKYSDKLQAFELMAEEKMEELKEIEEAIGSNGFIDPFEIIGRVPKINPGESPDDLYNRTVHSGNIGTAAYDYIENYVGISLQLPTFNDLVGDTFYG